MYGYTFFKANVKLWLGVLLSLLLVLVVAACEEQGSAEPNTVNLPIITNQQKVLEQTGEETQSGEETQPADENSMDITNLPLIVNEENVTGGEADADSSQDNELGGITNLPLITNQTNLANMDTLEFVTIERVDDGSSVLYEAPEAGLMLIGSPNDVNLIRPLVSDEAGLYLLSLNYDTHFALIAFDGWKPTQGSSIQVNQLKREDDSVFVYAQRFISRAGSQQASSPYHLIEVEKTGEWDRMITFHLIVGGEIKVSSNYFIR